MTDAANQVTLYDDDPFGNLTQTTDPTGNLTTTWTYDAYNTINKGIGKLASTTTDNGQTRTMRVKGP